LPLSALPCISLRCLPFPEIQGRGKGRSWGKENLESVPGLWGLSSSFTKEGIGGTSIGTGSLGKVFGGKVKFNDTLSFNSHITLCFVLKKHGTQ
jgi:hypothetical protein